MSLQTNMISSLEDGLNANADNNDTRTNNHNDSTNNVNLCDGDKHDKPNYFDIECHRNLNIRCISADFEVIIHIFLCDSVYHSSDKERGLCRPIVCVHIVHLFHRSYR